MSGIGFWELIILFLIGLIVLGPERLPRVANQLGTWLGQARRMTRVMRRQLEEELDFEKELSIKPDPDKTTRPSYSQPEYVSQDDKDDTYSPAHDADGVGTGVNDDDKNADDDASDETTVAVDVGEDSEADGTVPDTPVEEKTA